MARGDLPEIYAQGECICICIKENHDRTCL